MSTSFGMEEVWVTGDDADRERSCGRTLIQAQQGQNVSPTKTTVESKPLCDCNCRWSVFNEICRAIACLFFIPGTVTGIGISMIVMGAIYLDDCPAQPMIPIHLIVAGVLFLVIIILAVSTVPWRRHDEKIANIICIISKMLLLVQVVWCCVGSYYTYDTRDEFSDDTSADDFCDIILYNFAFCVLLVIWILPLISCCLTWCCVRKCNIIDIVFQRQD